MNLRACLLICLCLCFAITGHAGVVVTENVSPGATSWPGTPFISTVSNPSSTSVAEGFNGGGGNTNLSDTFTIITTNYILTNIEVYVSGGSGTGTGTNLTLNLYDLGNQTAPNPSQYNTSIIEQNLLGGGAGLSINYVSQAAGVMQLSFTGPDQVVLTNGQMYAFELTGVNNSDPIQWWRGITQTYTGGAAYRNQSWINGTLRNFALALYGTPTPATITNGPVSPLCFVNWTNVYQRIDGFGASSAWIGTWNQSQANILFSTNNGMLFTNNLGAVTTNNGIALSLLRNHIVYCNNTSASSIPTTAEISIMQMAQALGARVWSTPWTPAAGFKGTNDIYDTNTATQNGIAGGTFLGKGNNITNLNYASQLANYVLSMKNNYGINLYGISIQNEPNVDVTSYEACQWTNSQIHDFVTNLYIALAAKGVGSTKIIMPEDEHWETNLLVNAMTDPAVSPDVGVVACHNYDANSITPMPTFTNPNAATWETEVYNNSDTLDSSITNGLYWAGRIHLFMTAANVNAWHYWWTMPYGGVGLTDTNGSPTKRMFVLGQFSRFVRPNFYRVGVTNAAALQISAYKDTNSLSYAIVAVNSATSNVVETFVLTNFPSAASVTPWITSGSLSLAPQTAVAVTNLSFTYSLPAMSVVTFAGVATNQFAPTLAPIPNLTNNAGVTMNVTNLASDVDAPPQPLTFALLSAPANALLAQLNNTNAVFTWRPLVAQAGTTNLVKVQVSDGGTPVLSATNSFTIVVNPLVMPVLSGIGVSSSQVVLTATGMLGPDYTLWSSTNLVDWQSLFTTNPSAMPVTLTDTNPATDYRFYRLQLGP